MKPQLAINPDGSINDCTNPAPAGSTVTVMMNGFGVATPALATGAIAQGAPVSLTPVLRGGSLQQLLIDPSLPEFPLRERVIVIWTR